MIKPLRKYHYLIWRLWAVLLPVGFAAAIIVRPASRSTTTEKDGKQAFTADITSGTDSTFVVTVTVGRPIHVPSCVVILSSPGGEMVLGTLSRQGHYRFSVPTFDGTRTLNLIDAIHQKRIATIHLSKNGNTK